jgi:hypothetical protein
MKLPSFAKPCIRALLFTATFWSVALIAFADDANQRKYPAADIFINNHKFGDTNGCSGQLGVTGRITCGHPGHVSEVTWTFLRFTPEGDIYKITRKYPSDSATPITDTKEATYSGKPLILWHDDYQNIILRPKPAA